MDAGLTDAEGRTDTARELAQLRRRAYGPGADIARDPDAVRRLEILERAQRMPVRRAADAGPAAPAGSAALAGSAATTAQALPREERSAVVSPASAAAAEPPVPASPVRAQTPWWRRRSTWIVGAAGLAIGGAVVWGGAALAAPRPDAVLQAVSSTEEERGAAFDAGYVRTFDIDDTRAQKYDAYRDVTAWTAPTRSGGICLFLTLSSGEASGTYGGSCVPAGLDPMADLTVWEGMQPSVLDGLPVGSVARFTYRDGVVVVDEGLGQQSS